MRKTYFQPEEHIDGRMSRGFRLAKMNEIKSVFLGVVPGLLAKSQAVYEDVRVAQPLLGKRWREPLTLLMTETL